MYSPYEGKFLLSESGWEMGSLTGAGAQTHPWTSQERFRNENVSNAHLCVLKPGYAWRSPTRNSGVNPVHAEGTSSSVEH